MQKQALDWLDGFCLYKNVRPQLIHVRQLPAFQQAQIALIQAGMGSGFPCFQACGVIVCLRIADMWIPPVRHAFLASLRLGKVVGSRTQC
jgi:hypothetical protein